ncbi:conserved hypothetical protein [Gammaproteobacteria bacterium]
MPPWWLVALCVASWLLAGVALWLAVRSSRPSQIKTEDGQLRVLRGDLAALCACQAEASARNQTQEQYLRAMEGRMELRLEAMEQRLRQLARRQDEQIHTTDPGETSYGAAIRLAHQGANVEQLVNTFGLARGEAELIAALHRAQHEQG